MEQYLEFAKGLAKEAEEIALSYFSFETDTTWKEDGTPLTKADTEINDLVIKRINEKYPDHSIYGEEKSDRKEGSKYIWVCDPIDGTMAFSCGLPLFVFSIALVDSSNGLPIMGLINDPVMKNMYWARKDGGAYRNGKKISVLSSTTLKNTYLNTGASGRAVGFSNLPLIKTLSEKKCAVMKYPSFIYGGIQVANGKYIGAVYYERYGHDVAALKIITEEAGGKVTDLNGSERRYDENGIGCILSNGILHQEILDIVQAGKN
ncbi:MAG: inositol monophosphatase [Legionella sp.]|uniref:inositol monophosphatase family protein n=1 Tax=Legionella sp. TaxID=459 RepID=UPI002843DF7E|nr:inositol monophosphatase [Legionella sp.]